MSAGIVAVLVVLLMRCLQGVDFDQAFAEGERILKAIDTVHEATGRYPDSLEALPEETTTGLSGWNYRRYDDHSFAIWKRRGLSHKGVIFLRGEGWFGSDNVGWFILDNSGDRKPRPAQ